MCLLELTGLKDVANLRPQVLSGGMKQRAAFCRAMLSDPRLLLLDEPFGALDALTREESLELSRLWQKLGRTELLITHDIEEAILLGDRVLIMSARPGTIRADTAVDLPRPRNAETARLPHYQQIESQVRDIIFNRAQASSMAVSSSGLINRATTPLIYLVLLAGRFPAGDRAVAAAGGSDQPQSSGAKADLSDPARPAVGAQGRGRAARHAVVRAVGMAEGRRGRAGLLLPDARQHGRRARSRAENDA